MPYTPATVGDPNALRKFSDAKVEEAMQACLAKLPRGKRGAVIMYADQTAIRGAVYGRRKGKLFGLLPGEWTYAGTIGRTYDGKLEGMASVGYSWP